MVNENENEAENENRSCRCKINRSRLRHGLKYTKFKLCLNIVIVICITQHLSNI